MLSSLPVGRAVEVADCPFCVFPAEVKRGGALPLSHLSGGKQAFSCVPVKAVFPHSFIDGPATSGAPHTSSYKAIVLFSVLRKTVSCLSEKVPVSWSGVHCASCPEFSVNGSSIQRVKRE